MSGANTNSMALKLPAVNTEFPFPEQLNSFINHLGNRILHIYCLLVCLANESLGHYKFSISNYN